jgi:dihydrofolate synthase/folylpolyglutamate synthase
MAMTLGLGNIRALLERLGNPERRFRSIVIAGTNGKGSVTAMLASILSYNGYHVGRFISPHVYSVTERVSIDGDPVSIDEMERAAERVASLRDELTFSYFEAITAIAFLLFAERGVEYAVLETGLGGRFDATNAVEPDLSIITGISLDHRRILGDSEEEILREKLGVTRPKVPLLVGRFSRPLRVIVEEKSQRDAFPVLSLDDLGTTGSGASTASSSGFFTTCVEVSTQQADYGAIDLPFPGDHQAANALLAIGAAERIAGRLRNVPEALSETYLPGRFETVEAAGKTFVLDVAHNDQALSAAVAHLSRCSPREDNALVLGLMRRKELFDFPRAVAPAVGRVYLVTAEGGDALSPAQLLEKYLYGCTNDADIDIILWNRLAGAGNGDDPWLRLLDHLGRPDNPSRRILVTGSHHVVDQFGRRLFTSGEFV